MLRYREAPFIPDEIKVGDIIGFSGDSWISALVNIAKYVKSVLKEISEKHA